MSNPYATSQYCYSLIDPNTHERYCIFSAYAMDRSVTEIVVPAAREDGAPVRELFARAFQHHTNLRSVTLPDSIRDIRDAFYGVETLEHVNIPASVTQIKIDAFSGCKALMELRIPPTVTFIEDTPGSLPFEGCGGAKRTGKYHNETVETPPYTVPTYGSDSETRYMHGDDVEIYNGYAVKPGRMEEIRIPEYKNGPYGKFTLIVDKDSYAEAYARRMGIQFRYAENSKPQ